MFRIQYNIVYSYTHAFNYFKYQSIMHIKVGNELKIINLKVFPSYFLYKNI